MHIQTNDAMVSYSLPNNSNTVCRLRKKTFARCCDHLYHIELAENNEVPVNNVFAFSLLQLDKTHSRPSQAIIHAKR